MILGLEAKNVGINDFIVFREDNRGFTFVRIKQLRSALLKIQAINQHRHSHKL